MFHDYQIHEQSKAWMAELRADGDHIRRGRAARPEKVEKLPKTRSRAWASVAARLRTSHA